MAKAIVWTQTTPRDQVIARFTKIIQKRHRNESAAVAALLTLWEVLPRAGAWNGPSPFSDVARAW